MLIAKGRQLGKVGYTKDLMVSGENLPSVDIEATMTDVLDVM